MIASDISRPLEEQGGMVVEVNAGPGLQMHVYPQSGKPRPVGEAIVATLFPATENGRIPLVSVTGSENTRIVAELIAHLLATTGRTVGLSSARGIFVGDRRFQAGDFRGAEGARNVLLNPLVEAAVLETSLESILEEGLGFDRCDVAVITSIGQGLHLDFAQWDSPEKKSLVHRGVGDVVLPEGVVVLKAGEPLGLIVAKHCPGRLVLFSTTADEPTLGEHRSQGGKAVYPRDGKIVCCEGAHETAIAELPNRLPAEVALTAVAAARALGVADALIAAGLESFSERS